MSRMVDFSSAAVKCHLLGLQVQLRDKFLFKSEKKTVTLFSLDASKFNKADGVGAFNVLKLCLKVKASVKHINNVTV